MSDTTKITKARVNGVLYDLGGESGGSTGVSGAYLAPGFLIDSGYHGFENVTIDPLALIEQLEKAGVNVDEPPFLDENETRVEFYFGSIDGVDLTSKAQRLGGSLIDLSFSADTGEGDVVDIYFFDSETYSAVNVGDFRTDSIRTLILAAFEYLLNNDMEVVGYLYSANIKIVKYISNDISIYYTAIDSWAYYFIPNMTEFCSTALVEYTPGSDSNS